MLEAMERGGCLLGMQNDATEHRRLLTARELGLLDPVANKDTLTREGASVFGRSHVWTISSE